MNGRYLSYVGALMVLALPALNFAGCAQLRDPANTDTGQVEQGAVAVGVEPGRDSDDLVPLSLPELQAAELGDGKLRAVATTSVIGDVVSQIGGNAVELTVLMKPGQDPHSYELSARDLTAVANSHVVFVNGWDLEEGLVTDLSNVVSDAFLVPVSANIVPLEFGDRGHQGEHPAEALKDSVLNAEQGDLGHRRGPDPHTWLNPQLARQWLENIERVLAELDPANAPVFSANAAAYLADLESLIAYYDRQVATIPVERRKLVTNHDSLGYFADAYGFEVIGLVIPAASTLAEPSARDLANVVEAMEEQRVCTIFADATVSQRLAEQVASELDACANVAVVTLYTGALGPAGSGADDYLGMMRANIDAIAGGLR